MEKSSKVFEDELFSASTTEKGWSITHKQSGKSAGINFKAIPEDSSKDYVLGYAKCLAYQEGWILP